MKLPLVELAAFWERNSGQPSKIKSIVANTELNTACDY